MAKYLDETGLSYFLGKLKTLFAAKSAALQLHANDASVQITSSSDTNGMFSGDYWWYASSSSVAPPNIPKYTVRGRIFAFDLLDNYYAFQIAFLSDGTIYKRNCTSRGNKTWTAWVEITSSWAVWSGGSY